MSREKVQVRTVTLHAIPKWVVLVARALLALVLLTNRRRHRG